MIVAISATFYSIMLIENILLVILWSLGLESTPYNWNLTNILVGVFAAFLIGLLFMVLYYRFFHVRKLSTHLSYSPNEEDGDSSAAARKKAAARQLHRTPTYCSSSGGDGPAVTVFNCALNPALRKKKKLPSRSVPPPPPPASTASPLTPFWKSPLPYRSENDDADVGGIPQEERTAGDGLSYSRTTSVDDIRQKLQEKREKQMQELRQVYFPLKFL
jgi:XK-related protein